VAPAQGRDDRSTVHPVVAILMMGDISPPNRYVCGING
jgi:hypothetical protein